MKSFVILLLIFALPASVAAQYDFDAKERERMARAKVKTQTQWTHDYVDGKPAAKGYRAAVTKYDTRGNITEVTNYDQEGKVILIDIHQYDSRNNKVNFERYQGNRQKLQNSLKLTYDARGNKTRESGFDGASAFVNTFKYDAAGKLSEIEYTVDNVLVEKRKFVYSGSKAEITVYDASNTLTFKQENAYNDQGLLVSEIKTGNRGNLVHSLNFNYNSSGALMEEVKTRADEKLDYQKTYQYDRENRPVKVETVTLDGIKYVSNEYQYNENGDVSFESWRRNERAKEASTKKTTYDAKRIVSEMDCYFATYQLKSLYKYTYEFY